MLTAPNHTGWIRKFKNLLLKKNQVTVKQSKGGQDWRNIETLEPRLMLSGDFFSSRADFMNDPRVGETRTEGFDDLAVGTDLVGDTLSNASFDAPGSVPLQIIEASTGVRNPMSASTGDKVLSPGGSDVGAQEDDLEITFETSVQAAGIDVVFDDADGIANTSVTFYDESDTELGMFNVIAPSGAPGFGFAGYVSDEANIKRMVIDEGDGSAPDDHVAYDSLTYEVTPEKVSITTSVSAPNQGGFDSTQTHDGVFAVIGGPENGWATLGNAGNIVWAFERAQSVESMRIFTGDNGGAHDIGRYDLYYTTDEAPSIGGNWLAIDDIEYVPGFGTGAVANHINITNNEIRMNATGSYVSSHPNTAGSIVSYELALGNVPANATGIRMQAIEEAGMPSNGPGLASNGNFVVSEVEFFTTPPETVQLDINFNAGVDDFGMSQGQLVFNGPNGFQVTFTDDDSTGPSGDADGVHITNMNSGNIKVGSPDDFVLGAYNTPGGNTNPHSSGIVAMFNQGIDLVSLFDSDDDGTLKTLYAFDIDGNLIGQTVAGSQQQFTLTPEDTGGVPIYSVEFDTAPGMAGGSADGTFFTIDNFYVEASAPEISVNVEPVSYDMLNGQSGSFLYHDEIYDGTGDNTVNGAALSGGLGQLTDGEVGADEYATNLGNGAAYEWVGWSSIQPEITFDFGEVVELSGTSIHANNSLDVGLWGNVDISFSDDGVSFSDAVSYTTSVDQRADATARFIDVPFNRSAQYVRMNFADGNQQWIFLSEIDFYGPGTNEPGPTVDGVSTEGVVGEVVNQIDVTVSNPLDFDAANNANNYELLHLGFDGAVGGGDDSVINVTPSYTAGATSVMLSVDNGPLLAGEYQLMLKSGANGLRDIAGLPLDGDGSGVAGGDFVQAFTVAPVLIDVYDWTVDQENPVGQIQAIQTAETGQQHYSFSSASGHPSNVNLSNRSSNLWIHRDTNTNDMTFGFIFSQDNGVVSNQASLNFRIFNSDTDTFVSQSDDPGEATEIAPGAFRGTFNYGNNSDGIAVSGIGGNRWTIIIESVDFGHIDPAVGGDGWFAASGETGDFTDDLELVIGHEYRFVPAGRTPAQEEVNPKTPTQPSPEDEAMDVRIDEDVNWSVETPVGLVYDVLLGTDEGNLTQVATGLPENTTMFEPGDLLTETTYFWQVVARGGGTFESDVWTFTTEALPDLAVTSIDGPSVAEPNGTVGVTYTVMNDGGLTTGTGWTDRVYLSTDDVFDGSDTVLGAMLNEVALGAGDSLADLLLDITLPDVATGDYYLFVVSDDAGEVRESDEGDNVSAGLPITLVTPVSVVSVDPGGPTNQDVSTITLDVSGPLEVNSANESANFILTDLGNDGVPGGGDDTLIPLTPSYTDFETTVTLTATGSVDVDLNNWTELDYTDDGSAGDWRIEQGGASVKQYINGAATFYASDFDFIDSRFVGQIIVEENAGDDDFIGVAFGMTVDETTGRPDSYYLLQWKQTPQTVASPLGGNLLLEEGFVLFKVTDAGELTSTEINNQLYLEDGPNVEVLDRLNGAGNGWADNTLYDFDIVYRSGGDIDLEVRRSSDGQVFYANNMQDGAPLGTGKIAFYNLSQSFVRYSGLQQQAILGEGLYQLRVQSGENGVQGENGLSIDGDGDGISGDDFVTSITIDKTAPTVADVTISQNQIQVTFEDNFALDEATVTDAANYMIFSSGGDGTHDDGNEVDLSASITGITYDAVSKTATLTIDPVLADEMYQVTIKGSSTVTDAAGNALNDGADEVRTILLDAVSSNVTIDLQDASDSGVSNTDNLTNDNTPTFDVTVNEAGLIEIHYDGDNVADETRVVSGAGTESFTAPTLGDGLNEVRAVFTADFTGMVESSLTLTVDTQGPEITVTEGVETAPWTERTFVFNEVVDPATIDVTDFVLTGPNFSDLGNPDTLNGSGTTWTATFGPFVEPGNYNFAIGAGIQDLAGNSMSAVGNDPVVLNPDTTGPIVVDFEPLGTVGEDVSEAMITFNEFMDASSFSGQDVVITTPTGVVNVGDITVTPIDDVSFLISFPTLSDEGDYTVEIGPEVTDLAGNTMSQGSSQLQYSTDFESGVDGNWSSTAGIRTSDYGISTNFVGQYDNQTVSLVLDNLPVHTSVTVVWDLLIIDSWDGNSGGVGPDYWGMNVVGHDQNPVFEETFSNLNLNNQSYDGLPDTNGHFPGTNGSWLDSIYESITETFDHTDDTLQIDFYGRNLQFVGDEGWGIDDVKVFVTTTGTEVFTGQFTIDKTGPKVVEASPDVVENTPINSLDITFDEAIAFGTLGVGDVTIDGPLGAITPTSVVQNSPTDFTIAFPVQNTTGFYDFTINPTATDAVGNVMNQDMDEVNGESVEDQFTHRISLTDTLGPFVAEFVPTGTTNNDVSVLQVRFNEPIDEATFTTEDVELTLPDGTVVDSSTFTISKVDETTFDVMIPNQTGEGEYEVNIGPLIADVFGNLMVSGGRDFSTILTFDAGLGNGGGIPQSYGDNVANPVEGGFSYGTSASGPFTPNVETSYGGGLAFWNSSYGDLSNVVYSGGLIDITFTADPSYLVALHGFDLAGWPDTDYQINSVRVLNEDGEVLFESLNAKVEGDLVGARRSTFDFGTGLIAEEVRIQINTSNLGGSADNIGIDNIEFSQIGAGAANSAAFNTTFTIDKTGATITQITPDDTVFSPVDHIDIVFDGTIDPSTLTSEDLTITGPGGELVINDISLVGQNTYRASFETQRVNGNYDVVIGDDIEDTLGNLLTGGFVDSFEIALPDLSISSVSIPFAASFGDEVNVSYTVENQGVAITGGTWTDRVYLSMDDVFDENDELLGDFAVSDVSIAENGQVTRDAMVELPLRIDLIDGDYFLIVVSDALSLVEESNEGNNVGASSTIALVTPPVPDLQVEDITVPVSAFAGETIEVSWFTSNNGDADATGIWDDRVYLSTDATLGGGDTLLATLPFVGTIQDGASLERFANITLPSFVDTDWYIIVETDSTNLINEHANEGNNATASMMPIDVSFPPLPDLVVSDITVSGALQSGQPLDITWTVENAGNDSVTSLWSDRLVIRNTTTNTVLYNERIDLSSLPNNELLPGMTVEQMITFNLPDGVNGIGDFNIEVTTDEGNDIFEVNQSGDAESNNSLIEIVTTSEGPIVDLEAVSVIAPTEAAWSGRSVQVSWTVKNVGQKASDGAGAWRDRIYLSSDNMIGGDTSLGTIVNPVSIAVDGEYMRTATFTLPHDIEGEFYLVLEANTNDGQYEINETNNIAISGPFTVNLTPEPDLIVTSVTGPTGTRDAGSIIHVDWVVENQGAGSTTVPFWKDRVYLSGDQVLDGTDIALSPLITNPTALASGESYQNGFDFVLPDNIVGEFYVIVKADAQNQMLERNNENNNENVSVETIEITPVAPAILEMVNVSVIPPNPWRGDTIDISWRIQNVGQVATGSISYDHAIVLSEDADFDQGSDRFIRFHVGDYVGNLLPGETSEVIHATVQLPQDVIGEWYVLVFPDPPQQTGLDRISGSAPISIQEGIPSDLVVDEVIINPEAQAGFSTTVSWTVRNASVQPTRVGSWDDRVVFSIDDNISTTGDNFVLGVYTHNGVLELDDAYTRTVNVLLPATFVGDYHVFVETDVSDRVLEIEPDDNNVGTADGVINVISAPPDLRILEANVSVVGDVIGAGATLNLDWTVINAGLGALPGNSFNTSVYLSEDATFDGNDIRIRNINQLVTNFGPGDTVFESETITIPESYTGDQAYIFVVLDNGNSIFESIENNNVTQAVFVNPDTGGTSGTVNVTPPPTDLRIVKVTATLTGVNNSDVRVTWEVLNAGGLTTANGWLDTVYLSQNPLLDASDIQLGQFTRSGALGINQKYARTETLDLPSGLAGSFYVIVKTDSSMPDLVEESNENNNTGTRYVQGISTVDPESSEFGDLEVVGVDGPATGFSGQVIPISWTVRNNGPGEISTAWNDHVYISLDQFLDTSSDFYIGRIPQNRTLASGEDYTATSNFNVPSGLTGPYYVIVSSDAGRRVAETNEFNNIVLDQTPTQLELTPQSDLTVDPVSITGPTDAIIGQSINISWTVVNDDNAGNTAGTWRDAVYLSLDDELDISDIKLGEVIQTGVYGPGESYNANFNGAVPGILPGTYNVLVRTDVRNELRETVGGEDNNLSVSLGQVNVDIQEIQPGEVVVDNLARGDMHYFKINLDAGQSLKLDFDSSDNNSVNEVFVRYGQVPSRGGFDFTDPDLYVPDPNFNIPIEQSGTYYIMLFGSSVNGAPEYEFTAELLPFSVLTAQTDTIGQLGDATIQIGGALFDGSTQFQLVSADGEVIPAESFLIDNSTLAFATFNLSEHSMGEYDLRGTNGAGDVSILEDAVNVIAGEDADLNGRITGPELVRADRINAFFLTWDNVGDVDDATPLIIVNSPTSTPFGMTRDGLSAGQSIHVLGVPDEGPVGILRPNTSYRIPMFFNSSTSRIQFTERIVTADSVTPIDDWSVIESAIRPTSLSDEQWGEFWAQIQPNIGTTWGSYVRLLNRMQAMVGEPGEPIRDVRRLFAAVYDFEPEFKPTASVTGTLYHSDSGNPLRNVEISLFNKSTGLRAGTATTDSNGNFTFGYLLNGEYSFAVETEYILDQDRDGNQDTDELLINISNHEDVDDITVFADEFEQTEAASNTSSPSFTTDSQGRGHMVWVEGASIYHSWFDGTTWRNPTPIPGIMGASPVVEYADDLIDGTDPGLIVMYQAGEGNDSEIEYVIGVDSGGGVYDWSEPIRVTDDGVRDRGQSVHVTDSGQVLTVYQKSDFANQADDTDLYYSLIDVNGDTLTFVIPASEQNIFVEPEALSGDGPIGAGAVDFSVSVGIGHSVSIPAWVPLIGGGGGFGGGGSVPGTATKTSAQASGSVDVTANIIGEYVQAKGQLSASLNWNCDPDLNHYVFSNGQISGSIGGAINVPVAVIPIPQILGSAKVTVGGSLTGSGTAQWDKGQPFPGPASSVKTKLEYSASISGGVDAGFGFLADATVTGSFNVSSESEEGKGRVNEAKVKVEAVLTVLKVFKVKRSVEWSLAKVNVPGGGSSEGLIGSGSDVYVLPDGTAVTIDPEVGTGNSYGSNSVIPDVSDDVFNDSKADIAEDGNGQILAAWAKDGDFSQGEYGSVVVSEFTGSMWDPLVTLPGTNAYNSDVQIEYDRNGNAIVVWRSADMTGIDENSTAEEGWNALANGDVKFATYQNGVWSNPMNDLDMPGNDARVKIGLDANNDVVATWVNIQPGTEQLMASTWDGSSWSAAQTVAMGGEGAFVDGATVGEMGGKTIMFWTQDVDIDPMVMGLNIRYSFIDGSGDWVAPADFDPNSGFDFFAGVTVSETGTETLVREGSTTDSITMVLTGPPSSPVTVDIITDADVEVDGSTSIVFDSTNWNQVRTITLRAVDDLITEGTETSLVSFDVSSDDPRFDNIGIQDVEVEVKDNERGRVIINESDNITIVSEDGLMDTYTVVLSDQPDENVLVNFNHNGQVLLDLPTDPLLFTPDNWNIPQTVVVNANDDPWLEGGHDSLIRHSTSSADSRYSGLPVVDVIANIIDNELSRVIISESFGSTNVQEENTTEDNYFVALASQPTSGVLITFAIQDTSQISLVSFESLYFTPDDWDEPREIVIRAREDDVAEGTHHVRIEHYVTTVDPAFQVPVRDVIVNVGDNDSAGVIVSHTDGGTHVVEGEDTDTITVRLTSEPTGPVTVEFSSEGETQMSPSIVTFGPGSWSTPRTVTVIGVDDFDIEGLHGSRIDWETFSSDDNYDDRAGFLNASVVDGEEGIPGVAIRGVDDGRIDVIEGADTDQYEIVLLGEPVFPVTVSTVITDGQTTVAPGSVTFTADNWDQPQRVTVIAIDDGEDEPDHHHGSIGHQVNSADPRYQDIPVGGVLAHITDRPQDSSSEGSFNAGAGGSAGGSGGPPPHVADCDDDDPPYEPEPVFPQDPNDILGPEGFGEERFVSNDDFLSFTIRFENQPSATAPAQEVIIVQEMDPDLDLRTFQLGEYGWSDLIFEQDSVRPNLFRRIDLTETEGYFVDVTAGIDLATNTLTWTFTTIDPVTGDKPLDALTGFLAINDDTGIGEGFIRYTVRTLPTAQTGDVINSEATIVFDTEGPIDTPPIFNTIDAVAPTSMVDALPPISETGIVDVDWSGEDDPDGSGVAYYDVYVSLDDGPFEIWLENTTETSGTFVPDGSVGKLAFYSVAVDNVGNAEAPPLIPDASTVIGSPVFGDFDLDGEVTSNDITAHQQAVNSGATASRFDINGDGLVNSDDTDIILHVIFHTQYGDANLDGNVDLADLASMATNFGQASNWEGGDFNGDGDVDLADLSRLASNFGFAGFPEHDLTGDGVVDLDDLDRIAMALQLNWEADSLDINGSGFFSNADYIELATVDLGLIPGDLNFDNEVNLVDLAKFATNFNLPGNWADGDFTGDSIVDLADLAALASHFGEDQSDEGTGSGASSESLTAAAEDESVDLFAEMEESAESAEVAHETPEWKQASSEAIALMIGDLDEDEDESADEWSHILGIYEDE